MMDTTPVPSILLLGGKGQIGWELRRTLAPLGRVVAPPSAELDLRDPVQLRSAVRELHPAVIVNAAAYTAVDRAEAEPEAAHVINAAAPGVLAEEAERIDALLVHYSTDYVFDGAGNTPYTEVDATGPINVYGQSKLEGEQAIRDICAEHLILRTGWVYGTRGRNFLRTMLRLAREREELQVVEDQVGAPTWSRMVAEATAQILVRCTEGDQFHTTEETAGTFHLTAAGETSWFGFAREILALDPARHEQRCGSLLPVPTSRLPTAACRPTYSVLDNRRVRDIFGVRLPHWQDQLRLVVDDLAAHADAS